MFDNGEVLPDLDKPWTFLGATMTEWIIGFAVFVLISVFAQSGHVGRMIPFMLLGWVFTTYTLGSMRRLFPDGEKGLRNHFSTLIGVPPIGIPTPSKLQPVWSATPVKKLRPLWSKVYQKECDFIDIGLDKIFPIHQAYLEEPDDSQYIDTDKRVES